MSEINDGGPAFARPQSADYDNQYKAQTGLSIRDYFAGQALTGILGARSGFLVDCGIDNAPKWAYDCADAMLKEREKRSAE